MINLILFFAVTAVFLVCIFLCRSHYLKEHKKLTQQLEQALRMSYLDTLTGLKNRNSYQQFLSEHIKTRPTGLSCIYIDINGLHELNNHLGHLSGDKMLVEISHILQNTFEENDTYRIGGDEFIIFSYRSPARIAEMISSVIRQTAQAGYQISVGSSRAEEESWDLIKLITDAEQKMYQEKNRYYREKGDVKKARSMNRKLEQILQEKQDADTFLSIISPYFMGVYVVDLDTDRTRVIYQPSYFTTMLQKTGYKYREALQKYILEFVSANDQQGFLDFIDYEVINRDLNKGNTLEYRYTKKDGMELFLRICQAENYGTEKREAFWIFEKYK